ncbi:MAG TPA: oligosaccharide flippase family protein, partial [Steroidobacteraceae bacterium]|nr:oligosaccharide flippase family protein [Steroidobacteraceae bacterium]
LVAVLMACLAWPASIFYREPRVVPVALLIAVGAAIQGLENIGVVAFRKDMEFHKEFAFQLGKKLAGFAVTIPLALWLRSYWALVIGLVVGRVAGVILSYALHRFRPRFSLARAADLMHFSKWLMFQNMLTFLKERSVDFIVGRTIGAHALGIFSASAEIANMPGTELVAPINRAVLPAYAKLADDKPALRAEYVSVMSMIVLLAVPAVAGVAATAPLIVAVVLGPKWSEVAPLLTVLALFGISNVILSNSYSAFIALGAPQVFARITTLYVITLVTLLLILTRTFGVLGAAWAYVIAALGMLPVSLWLVFRTLELPAREFFANAWRPIVAAATMFVGVRFLVPTDAVHLTSSDAFGTIAVCVSVGVVTYVGMVVALWMFCGRPSGAESAILGQVRAKTSRWRARFLSL